MAAIAGIELSPSRQVKILMADAGSSVRSGLNRHPHAKGP